LECHRCARLLGTLEATKLRFAHRLVVEVPVQILTGRGRGRVVTAPDEEEADCDSEEKRYEEHSVTAAGCGSLLSVLSDTAGRRGQTPPGMISNQCPQSISWASLRSRVAVPVFMRALQS
jgi:hypothetical protein